MALRVSMIGSNSSAETLPGWNDFEHKQFERSFLTEGVIQGIGAAFAVTERGAGANMSVDVGSGRALIQITNTNLAHGETYLVYLDNSATINKSITTADGTHPRKDRVVLRIDVSQNPDGSSGNIAVVEVLAGTPAGSPTAPATPSNAISLAIIDIPASDTTISDDQISDDRSFVQLGTDVLDDVARTTELDGLVADLASTANGEGASKIGVEDADVNFTGDTVEEVLAELQDNIEALDPTPTGAVLMWTSRIAPSGWLVCNGQAVSRSTYADLFSVMVRTIGAFTITSDPPAQGIFNMTDHGLVVGDAVYVTTTGSLASGIAENTIYYVIGSGLTADQFRLSSTPGGSGVVTTGTGSGTHTIHLCPFGLGDGSTTFNVPDFRGRVAIGDDLMGASAASRVTAAPALGITGGQNNGAHTHPLTQGGSSAGGGSVVVQTNVTGSGTVLPPFVTTYFIIRT